MEYVTENDNGRILKVDVKSTMLTDGNSRIGDFKLSDKIGASIYIMAKLIDNYDKKIDRDRYSKEDIVKRTKRFFNDNYCAHKINYLPNGSMADIYYFLTKIIKDEEKLIKLYELIQTKKWPWDLPLFILNNYELKGTCDFQDINTNENIPESLKSKIPASFSRVVLDSNLGGKVFPTYIHEITHSQTSSNKGIIDEYYNGEVLPIFNELLYCYQNDPEFLNTMLDFRIADIYTCAESILNFNNKVKGSDKFDENNVNGWKRYIVSTLKAFKLLALYIDSTSFEQERILKSINRVFDGTEKLEEVLVDNKIEIAKTYNPEIIKRIATKNK